MNKELRMSLQKTFRQATKDNMPSTPDFHGEIIIQGTDLYRGEYGEDNVTVYGNFIRTENNDVYIYIYEGTPTDHHEQPIDRLSFKVNRNTSFQQLWKFFAIALAYHEGYEI